MKRQESLSELVSRIEAQSKQKKQDEALAAVFTCCFILILAPIIWFGFSWVIAYAVNFLAPVFGVNLSQTVEWYHVFLAGFVLYSLSRVWRWFTK